jgi:hypothetical protein
MTCKTTPLAQVCDVQMRNSYLVGEKLRDAEREIAALAARDGCAVMAADEAGERLVGAALVADERVRPVDVSRRLDGQSVVIVAGFVAGPAGIALKTSVAPSLGAVRVDAAVLGSQIRKVDGCDHVRPITQQPHLVAL